MSLSIETYGDWLEERVIVTANRAGKLIEIDGRIINLKAECILLKPRSSVTPELIFSVDIEDIKLYPQEKITAKELTWPRQGTVRQHLADRHGMSIEMLNSAEWLEGTAMKWHREWDHSKMSHTHAERD